VSAQHGRRLPVCLTANAGWQGVGDDEFRGQALDDEGHAEPLPSEGASAGVYLLEIPKWRVFMEQWNKVYRWLVLDLNKLPYAPFISKRSPACIAFHAWIIALATSS